MRAAAFACLLAAAAGGARAQPDAGVRLHFVGPDQGLPSPRVTSITQDSLGFVWVATNTGAARFDGVGFRVWRRDGGLPSSVVNALHTDGDGVLWAGTEGGLARFDPTTARFAEVARRGLDSLGTLGVRFLASDADGLLVAANGGIVRVWPDERVERRLTVGGSAEPFARVGGAVWFRGCRLTGPPTCAVDGDARDVGFRATWTEGGDVYTAEPDGTVWRDGEPRQPVERWPGLVPATFYRVTPGRVWLGDENGLTLYLRDRARSVAIGPEHGLRGRDVRAIFEDRQGGVWVGTERGLHRWTPPRGGFRAVTAAEGLPDDRVNGFASDADGVWVATNGGVFQHRRDGSFRSFLAGPDLGRSAVWQVAPAEGGGLWLGGKRFGLRRLWPGTGRVEAVDPPDLALDAGRHGSHRLPVRHVVEHEGRVWLATSLGLAVRERSGRWRSFRHRDGARDGLPSSAVNVVFHDGEGRVWVGTDRGLVRFWPGRGAFGRAGRDGPAEDAVVWHVAETPDDPGALWLATIGEGACRYVPATDRASCLTTADGLPSDAVHRIEAGDGALWLGTDRGLVRLDPVTGDLVTFTAADGLHGDVVDLMSSHRAADGTLYVGGPGGYTAFRPRDVRPSAFQPAVRFTSVEAGGRDVPVALGRALRLQRGARRFAARFAALDYTRPALNRYRYRLTPLEEEWTEIGAGSPEARYASLPPGAYTFEVAGSNHAGVFSPKVARLDVVVPPAWWERRSVRALLALLVVGALGALGAVRLRRSERRRAEGAEVARRLAASREAERVRLARELHDGAMQHLYRVGHDLDRVAALVPPAEAAEVASARAALDQAAGDLRGVLSGIRLPHVGTFGAAAAVRAVAERFRQSHPEVAVTLDLAADGRRWPVAVQHAATRIAQEALANVGRHADAATVRVSLADADGWATVEVADDGRGFDATVREVERVRGAHYGLAGLRERAEALGGRAEVTSRPGAGTRVRARLPLDG